MLVPFGGLPVQTAPVLREVRASRASCFRRMLERCSMLPVEARGGGAGGGDAVSVVRPQGSNLESKDAMNLA